MSTQTLQTLVSVTSGLPSRTEALPVAIMRFRSDFVIQFATPRERDLVASSEVLEGRGFDVLVITWSNRYGGKIVEWQTEVSIDIVGFPPHTFDPSVLAPLLERHCSIQAYSFSETRGACRVDAYALSPCSIPKVGEIGVQYPTARGVCNVVFSVTLTAYNYHEAPEFVRDDCIVHPAGYNPLLLSPPAVQVINIYHASDLLIYCCESWSWVECLLINRVDVCYPSLDISSCLSPVVGAVYILLVHGKRRVSVGDEFICILVLY